MKKLLLLLLLLLSSCATTKTTTKTSTRDSLASRVNTRVDSIYIDRWHTEKLHVGSDPVCSFRTDTLVIRDSIYVVKYRYLAKHDTVTVHQTDTIRPFPDPPLEGEGVICGGWRKKSLALSERVRVFGKGCLVGGIGALILLLLVRVFQRK